MGEALRAPSAAPLNPVQPAGALGSWVASPTRVSHSPRRRLERRRAVPDSPKRKRQRSETPVGLSQPTAQMVLTHVAHAATSEPVRARRDRPGLRLKSANANPVAVPTRPSERDTQRVAVEETHFLSKMPRPSAGEPV
jgi:hypothetical protein